MAGYFGLGDGLPPLDAGELTPSMRRCGDSLITGLAHPVEFSDDRYDLRCAAEGHGAVPGTDTLTLRRASARLATPEAGRAQILGTSAAHDIANTAMDR